MAREVVTSENREEFMLKKLAKKAGKKAKKEEEQKEDYEGEKKQGIKVSKPHGIWHSGTDKLLSHHDSEEKAYDVYQKLGQKMSDYAMGELSDKEKKLYGYK